MKHGCHPRLVLMALVCLSGLAGAAEYAPLDPQTWKQGVLEGAVSPVDLRFLNRKPAGGRGFVRPVGDHLEFEDGSPACFWGANLAAHALFVDDGAIEAHARRIAQLGFNLIRIHHHDSMRWVDPTVIDKSRSDSRHLDSKGLDRLDRWIAELKEQGVYIWLDLHVGRQLKRGDVDTPWGHLVGFEEFRRRESEIRGLVYFNEVVQDLMVEFNQHYLTHVNPYTGLAYKDDPSIVGLLLTNENDITHHFGNMFLPKARNPAHTAIFEMRAREFSQSTGHSFEKTTETWSPGPSKIFLNDREHHFNAKLIGHLKSLGIAIPIATTSMWGHNGLTSLPSLTDGSIIDAHSYGEAEALSRNPRSEANYLSWIGASQVVGMPLSVTEWNVPYPAADRFTAPLYTASVAALQGWDALLIYNYSQTANLRGTGPVSRWSSFSDPALMGVMPAAALAFRRADVRRARRSYCLDLDREALYYQKVTPATSAALRTLVEQSGLSICLPEVRELDWDRARAPAEGVARVGDLDRDFIPPGRDHVESDTGELRRDWREGIQTIDTPRTQAASGWIGGHEISLRDVKLDLETPKAVISVSSVDGLAIRESGHLLITAIAQSASPDGQMPLFSEPVRGVVRVAAREGLEVRPISKDGKPGQPLIGARDGNTYVIDLGSRPGTHWYLVRGV